jgi:hypothetical protein
LGWRFFLVHAAVDTPGEGAKTPVHTVPAPATPMI